MAQMSPIEELESALSLPRADRARLAERLLASLDEEPEVEAEPWTRRWCSAPASSWRGWGDGRCRLAAVPIDIRDVIA